MKLESIEQILTLLNEYPITEIAIERGGERIFVRKDPTALKMPAAVGSTMEIATQETFPSEPEASGPEYVLLNARMVGIFHHTKPPVGFGAAITTGQLVGHIETMKLMNEVIADEEGRVVEVLAEEGSPVEYGQPLFRLSPG